MALSPAQSSFINHLVLMEFEDKMPSEAAFLKDIKIPVTTASRWKKQPAFVAALIASRHAYINSPDYLATCMHQKYMYELDKQYKSAKDAEKRQYLNTILKRTEGAFKASQAPVSFRHMKDAELIASMVGDDMLPLEAAEAIIEQTKEGETDGSLVHPAGRSTPGVGSVSRMVPQKRAGGGDGGAKRRGSLAVR